MTTLVLERSTDVQSVAWISAEGMVTSRILDGADCRSGDWVVRVEEFLDGRRPDRIVVGVGPGSFAGIRAALGFAQGYALGAMCEVFGLPSPCALAGDEPLVVVGDARRGSFWVAHFEGKRLVQPVFQVSREDLASSVPTCATVVSPDARRIDEPLRAVFGEAYCGAAVPTAAGLARFALANPAALSPEPLPIYLNPAVRP